MTATATTEITTLTIDGETVTVLPLNTLELATLAEDIDSLGLPTDRHGFNALAGWTIRDTAGRTIGRLFSRGVVMTAEWYDSLEQGEWILAKWGCRRLERGIREIIRLRDQRLAEAQQTAEAEALQVSLAA